MTWFREKIREHELSEKGILEVGSQNVNGSVRELFRGAYTGVDMEEGKGVDVVATADELPFGNDTAEVVVSTEMLEHDPYFWLSIVEMARVLQPGGLLLLTTRGIGFHYHGFPQDYWRFTEDAIVHLLDYAGLEQVEVTPDPKDGHPGWFVIGRKPQRRKKK
jgi:SAM-dependent methyltransferase